MRYMLWCFLVFFCIVSIGLPEAQAYVGPGPGISVLGALWAVLAAVLFAILAVIKWPLRYLLRKIRKKGAPDLEGPQEKQQPDQ